MELLTLLIISAKSKYLVVIGGPTAVGKTDIGIRLARHYQSLILSADSRQFYKELNIGTAKPSPEQLDEVKHFFINTKNITELYGAGHFEKDAIRLLKELFENNRILFMVGGSGLYMDAVLNGVDDFKEIPQEIREELNKEYASKGLEWLQNEVEKNDNAYYLTVDKKNVQRLVRALEVFRDTGLPYSSFLNKRRKERNFIPIKILINCEREKLYSNINKRVDDMMQNGLLDEAKNLMDFKHCNALKTVGYKEIYEHLEGKYDLSTAVGKIKQHTRNYAKRQLTWFKNRDNFEEFGPEDLEKIKAYIDLILQHD